MIAIFSKASLPVERGIGRIYSQSRGRGHRKFLPHRPKNFVVWKLLMCKWL